MTAERPTASVSYNEMSGAIALDWTLQRGLAELAFEHGMDWNNWFAVGLRISIMEPATGMVKVTIWATKTTGFYDAVEQHLATHDQELPVSEFHAEMPI